MKNLRIFYIIFSNMFFILLLSASIGFTNTITDCEDFFQEYYEDTEILKDEACLKDGKINGPYKSYYPDGSLWESLTYAEGQLLGKDGKPFNGEYVSNHQNGIIAYKANLVKGQPFPLGLLQIWAHIDERHLIIG